MARKKGDELTKAELAERFGVTERTIENWAAEGMRTRRKSGRVVFSWIDCLRWHEQKIRDDERAKRHAGLPSAVPMAELKLREQQAITEQAEMDLAERRARTLTVEFAADQFQRFATSLRARLLTIPASWDGPLAGITTSVDRQIVLLELVNELLPVLGALVDGDESVASVGDDEEDADVDDDDDADDADEPEPPIAETGS